MTMHNNAVAPTDMPPKATRSARVVYLLRHGQTDLNAQGVLQGSIDAPLNQLGRAQAGLAADTLADFGIRQIVSSPQRRARETADIVADRLGVAISENPDLRERDWGIFEGKLWDTHSESGEGVETYANLRQRAGHAFEEITRSCDFPCLIVTHGGLIRALIDGIGGKFLGSVENCEIISVNLD